MFMDKTSSLSKIPPADPIEAQLLWQMRSLRRMTEIAMRLARAAHAQAMGESAVDEAGGGGVTPTSRASDAALWEASMTFCDLSEEVNRLIRTDMRLEARLAAHREARTKAAAAKITARTAERMEARREFARQRLLRGVSRGPLH
jgi:hypothetical protein